MNLYKAALLFILSSAVSSGLSAVTLFGVKRDAYVYTFDTATQPSGATSSFTHASLSNAAAVSVGRDGLVYVFDDGSGDIVRFTQGGSYVDVFSSTGETSVSSMVFDPSGNLFIVGQTFTGSSFDPWMYKLDASTGAKSARYDSGVPTAGFRDMAFTASGDIILSSVWFGSSYLYRLNATGAYQETLLTNTEAPLFDGPYSVLNGADDDSLYLTAHFQNRVLSYSLSGDAITSVASGISSINDLVVTGDGFYATGYQSGESVIYALDGDGAITGTFGSDINPLFIAAAIPEPQAYALFVGVLALGTLVWRKRHRAQRG